MLILLYRQTAQTAVQKFDSGCQAEIMGTLEMGAERRFVGLSLSLKTKIMHILKTFPQIFSKDTTTTHQVT